MTRLVVIAAFALGGDAASEGGEQCVDGRERIEAIWGPTAAVELGGVFTQRGPAAAAEWPYLRSELDRWVGSWIDVDAELCRRYGPVGVPQQQLDCLDRQLLQLESTIDVLATVAEAEVVHTTDLLASLPNPHRALHSGIGNRFGGGVGGVRSLNDT
jgi:hypothetical protein